MHTSALTRRIAAKALIIIALYLNFTGVCASPAPDESGTFNFLWENDTIAGTDHHYDAQAGFAVLWRKLRVAYTYVIRSREFEGQEQPDRFGSVGFTFRF